MIEIVFALLFVLAVVVIVVLGVMLGREKGQNNGFKAEVKHLNEAVQYERQQRENEHKARELELELRQKEELNEKDRESRVLQTLAPVSETLLKMQKKVEEIEGQRSKQYGALDEALKQQHQQQEEVRKTTTALSHALKSNQSRGQWGETQLRTIVEATGMIEHIDFDTQVGVGSVRPDMVINLPGNKSIVIDSKVPANDYLEAASIPDLADEAQEEQRAGLLQAHVANVKRQIDELAKKDGYFDGTVTESTSGNSTASQTAREQADFVILFIPSEAMLASALEVDPTLLEYAFKKRIALASPVSLFSVLKTVAHIWQQEALNQNAMEVGNLAKKLIEGIETLLGHSNDLATSLNGAVKSYNLFSSALNRRVLTGVSEISKKLEIKDLPEAQVKKGNLVDLTADGAVLQIENEADKDAQNEKAQAKIEEIKRKYIDK